MTGSQIDRLLSQLVDSFVVDNNPQALDDDLVDIMSDPEQRDEAVDDLIRYIEHNREFI